MIYIEKNFNNNKYGEDFLKDLENKIKFLNIKNNNNWYIVLELNKKRIFYAKNNFIFFKKLVNYLINKKDYLKCFNVYLIYNIDFLKNEELSTDNLTEVFFNASWGLCIEGAMFNYFKIINNKIIEKY